MKKRRNIKTEWFERLDRLFKTQKVLELSVAASPRDGRTPVVDFGEIQVHLHAAWNPGIGAPRRFIAQQTRRGRTYFVPADIAELPKGEFDLDTPRYFTAILQRDKQKRIFFRLPSGQFALPLNPRAWIAHGAKKIVGQEIELIGWPRSTCFVVMPRHGFQNIGRTTRISIHEDRDEKAMGLIRVVTTDDEKIPVFANVLLGIAGKTEFSMELIRNARAKILKSIRRAGGHIKIGGLELSAENYEVAVIAAYKLLEDLIKKGVKTLVSLQEEEFEGPENGEEPEAAELVVDIFDCPRCKTKNRYLARMGEKAEAKCGACGAFLFPEERAKKDAEAAARATAEHAPEPPSEPAMPETPAETAVVETDLPKSKPGARKPPKNGKVEVECAAGCGRSVRVSQRTIDSSKAVYCRKCQKARQDEDKERAAKETAEREEVVKSLTQIIGGPIKNGRIAELVKQTSVRDVSTFLELAKSEPQKIKEICDTRSEQLEVAIKMAEHAMEVAAETNN